MEVHHQGAMKEEFKMEVELPEDGDEALEPSGNGGKLVMELSEDGNKEVSKFDECRTALMCRVLSMYRFTGW